MSNTLKRFREAAEDCGFSVATDGNTIELHQRTPDGRDWWEQFTYDDEDDLQEILAERIDTWVSESDNDLWTDDDGEQDPCESFTDDEDWKLEHLERLYYQFVI